jgi:hypothetical protein
MRRRLPDVNAERLRGGADAVGCCADGGVGGGEVTADEERFAEWTRYIKASCDETIHVFWNRKLFRAVRLMFQTNSQLGSTGHHVWDWIAGMYVRDASMLVRQELDKQHGVLNLRNLLHDMEKHPHILPRYSEVTNAPSSERVKRDREELEAATAKVRDYAERLLAHRTSATEIVVTWDDLDAAVKAVLRTMRRYYGYLTGSYLPFATPVAQFDWLLPFTLAWATEKFQEPLEILRTRPEKPFIELGTVTATRFSPDESAKMHNAIRAKSSSLGATAVILIEEGIVRGGWGTRRQLRTHSTAAWMRL